MKPVSNLIADLGSTGVAFKSVGAVSNRASNIKWAQVATDSYKYIDLGTVDRITRKIGDSVTINAENAPSRAQQIVRAGDVIFATTRPTQMRWAVIPPEYDGQIASTGYCVLRPDPSAILTNYLAHLLGADAFRQYIEANQVAGNYPSISDNRVRAFRIPVPPLEAQRVIVRILDHFVKLEADLEAELEGRLRQIEFYRRKLFCFGDEVPRKSLGDIATIGTGSHDTQDAVPDGLYTFYARGREPLRLDSFDFEEQAVITAGDGAGVGKVFHFADGKYALHQRAYRVVPQAGIDPRYLYHFFLSDFGRYLEQTSVRGSVTSLRRPMFMKYQVPVPPLAEQQRISAILDKFEALVSDQSFGLPAELKARRQQYDYYREKLLTFSEVVA